MSRWPHQGRVGRQCGPGQQNKTWIDPLPSDIGAAWGSALPPASRSGDGYTYM